MQAPALRSALCGAAPKSRAVQAQLTLAWASVPE
jgi:hypothetical protein